MKEIDYFLHDEYIVSDFPELNIDREKFDDSVNRLKDKFESETLNIEEIYHILVKIELDDEIDGDLYYKKEAYLDIFRVLFTNYNYLED